jgi:hypothetical protein
MAAQHQQQWWDKHKAEYEKLEFGSPLSEILHPYVLSNAPPVAVSSVTVETSSVSVASVAEPLPIGAAPRPSASPWRWVVFGGLMILVAIGLGVARHRTKHRHD